MKERINYLLRQYFHNKSSRLELDELFAMIRSAKYDEELSLLIKELYEELKRQDPSLTYVDDDGRLLDFKDNQNNQHYSLTADKKRKNRNSYLIYIGVAVSAAMLIVGFFYGQQWRTNNTDQQIQVINSIGQDDDKIVVLDDGTKVWLNSSSTLEYPKAFKKGEPREVTLIGEAYFEVEHAEDWPFIVHTGDVSTKVLGTKFNVKAYSDMKDILVTVKSGKVMVSKENKILATLVKNQELRVPLLTNSISKSAIGEKDLKSKVAGSWTAGYLEYEDESISSIIADLERYFKISIDLRHPSLGDKVITLSVAKDSDPQYVLEILTTLTDCKFKKSENNYIIF
ncbi:FecR family protein [Sphingobacterium paucimobilis]|uniref:FecR protein domain-containing protein n=1 Tax=Sphingobacterium paucimobilis HER1398 TaxID=1346330 RepID=U2IWY0_9SPHI|nr:FecR domain-containing protein [Sphingobacterium paucimobilis]ERJ57194.1 hypothetical protein M472_00295 [Sphingobacterium paucimobilis HER1398]